MQKDREKQQLYEEYVKKVTPTHSLPANMVKAFLVGGLICVSGQAVTEWALAAGMDEKTAGTWCSIALIFLSALTTGMNLYPRLAKWGGAGTLVPITGERRTGIWNRKQDIYHSGTGDTLWGADLMGVGTDTVRGRKVVADGDRETEYSVGKAGLCGKLGIGCWKKRGGRSTGSFL